MCAYNAVNGVPACASDLLMGKYLRRDWGFKGFVVSDCGQPPTSTVKTRCVTRRIR
ncbi:glycoside hydrolase family 3 N-terminal domain-containing protein [Hankyongella ginsenosidimutans]|uniref:glycoside hydrolase family 3 N-terminal domain-containing protein n=1 Tax=Hankyongella ginsenosidimutans TaxID=1763828 RepID=UPI0024826840|nr:glycoside hydrolase family 3 N-terminal domain-containing protein [Hankyongella ginsenosidimutans]